MAAAIAGPAQLQAALSTLTDGRSAGSDAFAVLDPSGLQAFDQKLRRSEPPLLERISEDRRQALEDQLYGNAYKGVTDLVTKWLWPRPARAGVRICTRLGMTPNAVTGLSLVLMLIACWLFWRAEYGWGLALGWFMTYLDTVDGKLARVTVTSSRVGHLLDHGMDVIHPPFWYVFWGLSLTGFSPVLGLDLQALCWIVVAGYWIGRIVEGAFEVFDDARNDLELFPEVRPALEALRDRFVLHAAVGNIRTTEEHVRRAWDLVRESAASLDR